MAAGEVRPELSSLRPKALTGDELIGEPMPVSALPVTGPADLTEKKSACSPCSTPPTLLAGGVRLLTEVNTCGWLLPSTASIGLQEAAISVSPKVERAISCAVHHVS